VSVVYGLRNRWGRNGATFKVQDLQSWGTNGYNLVSLPIEKADQTVELERDHQKARKEFPESVDSSDQASPEMGNIPMIPFQRSVALGIDYGMAVVVDSNVVEEREEMEYGLERAGGQRT